MPDAERLFTFMNVAFALLLCLSIDITLERMIQIRDLSFDDYHHLYFGRRRSR